MKINSNCVGQKPLVWDKNIFGEITFNKKIGREFKLLVGQCSICNRKESMTVGYITIQAKRLGDFFKNVGRKGPNASEKMAKL